MAWASVVFPVPGGPHRITDTDPDAPLASFARFTRGEPGLSRCA